MGGLFAVDGYGDLRVFHGGEADERAMVRAAGGVLSSTGLAAYLDGEGVQILGAAEVGTGGAFASFDNLAHTFNVGIVGGGSNFHLAHDLGGILLDEAAVVGGDHAA